MFPSSSPLSEEVPEDLPSDVLSLGFLVVHDPVGRSQNDVAELSGRQDVIDELFEILYLQVVSRRNDSALVQSPNQLNNDLASSLVIHNRELTDVALQSRLNKKGIITMLLHNSKELNHDFGDWSEENLKNEDV